MGKILTLHIADPGVKQKNTGFLEYFQDWYFSTKPGICPLYWF